MNQYRRIVSYLYKYGNGTKGENTGFVRIDTRPEGIRLHFRIKDLRMMDERRLKVYFYFHREKRLQLVFVDEFLCVRGNCEYKKIVFPDFTDADFEKMNGVVFLDQDKLLYGSCWDEREISEDLFAEKENQSEEAVPDEEKSSGKEEALLGDNEEPGKEESMPGEKKESQKEEMVTGEKKESEKEEAVPEEEKPEEMNKDAVMIQEKKNSILEEFPEIILDGAENTIRAVRIGLQDISRLSSREWPLAENAFLKQAYGAQQHLLLGTIDMPSGDIIWILGVPGMYNNREKYLATIFGFTEYIPMEAREFKTGGKGYWIRQISL